jgi:hypothetical protein
MHEEPLEMFTTPPSIPMTYLPPPGRRLGKNQAWGIVAFDIMWGRTFLTRGFSCGPFLILRFRRVVPRRGGWRPAVAGSVGWTGGRRQYHLLPTLLFCFKERL